MSADRVAKEFAQLVVTLRDYTAHIVFVGGWAHRLHVLHELARPTGVEPLMTEDADVLMKKPSRIESQRGLLRDRLKVGGFYERIVADAHPPVTHYQLGEEDGGFYVEFLVPQRGPSTDRKGNPKIAEEISGVTAQRLPYIDILGADPWTVRLTEADGFPNTVAGIDVCVANPATYLAHKILVLDRRAAKKRPKDVLYIYDTLNLFSTVLPALRVAWEKAGIGLSPKARLDFSRNREKLAGHVTDVIRSAHRIALESGRGSPPDPEIIVKTLRLGLDVIFHD